MREHAERERERFGWSHLFGWVCSEICKGEFLVFECLTYRSVGLGGIYSKSTSASFTEGEWFLECLVRNICAVLICFCLVAGSIFKVDCCTGMVLWALLLFSLRGVELGWWVLLKKRSNFWVFLGGSFVRVYKLDLLVLGGFWSIFNTDTIRASCLQYVVCTHRVRQG